MEEPAPSRNDAEIVRELTRCQSVLTVYLRRLMPGDRAFEEVLQQTNAKIWEKRSEFEIGTNFSGWAMAVARFEVLNYRKKRARDARLQFSGELETMIADETQNLQIHDPVDGFSQRRSALKDCLDQLKPAGRELLLSRYESGESLGELAARIGRSVGGVRVSLSRLRSQLSDCIDRRIERDAAGERTLYPDGGTV